MKTHRPIPLLKNNEVEWPSAVENDIRHRAYQLYEERVRVDGYELEDWFRAEAEILSHHVQRKAAFGTQYLARQCSPRPYSAVLD